MWGNLSFMRCIQSKSFLSPNFDLMIHFHENQYNSRGKTECMRYTVKLYVQPHAIESMA